MPSYLPAMSAAWRTFMAAFRALALTGFLAYALGVTKISSRVHSVPSGTSASAVGATK